MRVRKHTFTLAEILAVIVIMSILVSIVVPAFQSSSKGKNLTAAATEIASQVSLARSYAIAHHYYTAVVFPTKEELDQLKSTSSREASALTNYYNASCRIAIVTRNSSGNKYQFVMWMPDSDWVLLPRGTIIDEDGFKFSGSNSDSGSDVDKNAADLEGSDGELEGVHIGRLQRLYGDPDTKDSDTKVKIAHYIIIRPGGSLVVKGAPIVTVTDGSYNMKKGKVEPHERNGEKATVTITFEPGTGRATYKSKAN